MRKQHTPKDIKALSRRTFLVAAPAAAMAPAAANAAAPDPHPEWFAEWLENRDLTNAHPTGEGPEVNIMDERRFELELLISKTPARTMEGARAQLAYLIEETDGDWCSPEHGRLANNLAQTLGALA